MGWRYGLWFAGVFRGADDDGVRPLAVEIRLPLVAFLCRCSDDQKEQLTWRGDNGRASNKSRSDDC